MPAIESEIYWTSYSDFNAEIINSLLHMCSLFDHELADSIPLNNYKSAYVSGLYNEQHDWKSPISGVKFHMVILYLQYIVQSSLAETDHYPHLCLDQPGL